MSWRDRFRSKVEVAAAPSPQTSQQPGEVSPPWAEYPGIPPDDFFWREAGGPWKTHIWEPFYNALSETEQTAYLERWKVPEDWQLSYFDKARREFWDHVDDPEE